MVNQDAATYLPIVYTEVTTIVSNDYNISNCPPLIRFVELLI